MLPTLRHRLLPIQNAGSPLLSNLIRSLPSRPGGQFARPIVSSQSNDDKNDEKSESSWRRFWSGLRSTPAEFIALGLYVAYDFGSGYYIGRYKAKARFSSNSYAWMPWSGEDTGEKDDEAAREESTQPILEGGYTPLRRSFEIRLLAIHPGEGDCQVECSLRHRKLRGNLQYEALSYVWGDATKISEVVCDGNPREVRGNLYDALKQLREPDQERFVWVDQLCINQEDNAEKTQQVRIMGEIYSRAQRVLIWLGKDVEMEKV